MKFTSSLAIFLLSLCTLHATSILEKDDGPSFRYGFHLGGSPYVNTTLPEADFNLGLTWMEPLFSRDEKNMYKTFIKTEFALEQSYLYTMPIIGVSIKPVPFFEFGVYYKNQMYLGSNAGMSVITTDELNAVQFQSKNIRDSLYENTDFDFIQIYQFHYGFNFKLLQTYFNVDFMHSLLDVNSSRRGFFYYYPAGVPVTQRDHVYQLYISARYKFSPHFTLVPQLTIAKNNLGDNIYSRSGEEEYIRALGKLSLIYNLGASKIIPSIGVMHKDSDEDDITGKDRLYFGLNWQRQFALID